CNGITDEDHPDLDGDGDADCVDEDLDGDGVPNDLDNCPGVANEVQEDLDDDGAGDLCDDDKDGDGVSNAEDCAPADETTTECGYGWGSNQSQDCGQPGAAPGCASLCLETLVCGEPSFASCCDLVWDENCADVANFYYWDTVHCNADIHQPYPGTGDPFIESCVCEGEPSCCELGWHQLCAELGADLSVEPGFAELICPDLL
ncbi:MAG: thrombospondin type 3 repeat-containing protein, partial [Myxococcota bacterium]|nr:thrombospondin type 3 repeat-containing protein [Myxococcota bacterium]